jgi:hypothetical protein
MPLVGSKEVAVALGVHERTAVRLFRSGEIKAFQVGRKCGRGKLWRTRPEILARYLLDNLGEIPALTRKPVEVVPPRRLAFIGLRERPRAIAMGARVL